MKLVKTEFLFRSGGFEESETCLVIQKEIEDAIFSIVWPPGNDSFVINPSKHGNGVKPIKLAFLQHLQTLGWQTETRLDIARAGNPGPIDAVRKIAHHYFAVEWETGNISSSHRALNKMLLGLIRDTLLGGMLVLPSRNLYPYLTDRVGNYDELMPYFDVWRNIPCSMGVLGVVVVEQDAISAQVPLIAKGTDGRELR